MRYAVSASAGTLLWAAVLACYLQSKGGIATASQNEEATLIAKVDDSNQQIEPSMTKRDWNRNLHSWGKRAWQSLQGGWGKRFDPWGSQYYAPSAEKRAWQNLQGGWGKRFYPEDEVKLRALLEVLAKQDQEGDAPEYPEDVDEEINEDEKRAWRSLNGAGWGKRADTWANFRGSWGKRDPAWTNLKGMWGKRSISDRITQ